MVRTAIYKKYFSNEENNKSKLPHTKTYEFLKNVVVNGIDGFVQHKSSLPIRI